jgi:hypothetical protein
VKQDKQVEEEKARKMEKERTLRDEELRALQQRLRANRSRSPTPTPPRYAYMFAREYGLLLGFWCTAQSIHDAYRLAA